MDGIITVEGCGIPKSISVPNGYKPVDVWINGGTTTKGLLHVDVEKGYDCLLGPNEVVFSNPEPQPATIKVFLSKIS